MAGAGAGRRRDQPMVRPAGEPAGCLDRAGGILQRRGGRGGLGGGHRGLGDGDRRVDPHSGGVLRSLRAEDNVGTHPGRWVRPLAPSLDTVGPMAADVAGLVVGMQLLEPGFALVPEAGSPRVGRLRVPAAPEVEDAVTQALRATSWEISDLDPGEWLTATRR